MTSTPRYSYSPRHRDGISVEMTEGAEDACSILVAGEVISTATGPATTMSVPDAKVPEVARGIFRAMHEAAGLPVPIVLDRVDESAFADWFEVRRGPERVLLDSAGPLDFAGARGFAAALAGAVERAESEPDPAEVEALAEVLHEARERCGGAGELDRQSARTILTRYTLTERKPGGASDA